MQTAVPKFANIPKFIVSCSEGLNFLGFVVLIGCLLIWISCSVGERCRSNSDKKIAFECGFDPIRNPRMPFSLPYFLVALLFIIFDVEVVLLLCVCPSLRRAFCCLPSWRVSICIVFCLILAGGLLHEINEGSLKWQFTERARSRELDRLKKERLT